MLLRTGLFLQSITDIQNLLEYPPTLYQVQYHLLDSPSPHRIPIRKHHIRCLLYTSRGENYAILSETTEEKDGTTVNVNYCLYDNGSKTDENNNTFEELVLETDILNIIPVPNRLHKTIITSTSQGNISTPAF